MNLSKGILSRETCHKALVFRSQPGEIGLTLLGCFTGFWTGGSGLEHLLPAQSPNRSGGPAPAPGFAESVPPLHILPAFHIAGRAHGNYVWFRFHFQDRTEACLQHSPMCEPAGE